MSTATMIPGRTAPGVGPATYQGDEPPVVRNQKPATCYSLWVSTPESSTCKGEFASYIEARDVALALQAGAGVYEVYRERARSGNPLFRRTVVQ